MPEIPRVVVVGAGFAGTAAAREASHRLRGAAEVVLVNPTDFFLYLPLLPEVAAGILDVRRVTVSLTAKLPDVQLRLAHADAIDLEARCVHLTDTEGHGSELPYDRVVVAVGSVNKLLPIPGVAEHAHGFRGVAEAVYLRDHLIRQVELAAVATDPAERDARLTFVVVGAGYTGTEVAAQGVLFTEQLIARRPSLRGARARWMLADLKDRPMPELDARLSAEAERVLRERGVEVRMGQSVEEATAHGARMSDGEDVPTRSLIWCVGVRPDPLVEQLAAPADAGRVRVDATLAVTGRTDAFGCGDAAAVPDLTRPGQLTAMTAQHAVRQGRLAGRNVAASLGHGRMRRYKHHDLGFLVDLGGGDAAANPLGVPLRGLPAKAITRGYHLFSMGGNRTRTAADWLLDAALERQAMQTGLVRGGQVPLETTQA